MVVSITATATIILCHVHLFFSSFSFLVCFETNWMPSTVTNQPSDERTQENRAHNAHCVCLCTHSVKCPSFLTRYPRPYYLLGIPSFYFHLKSLLPFRRRKNVIATQSFWTNIPSHRTKLTKNELKIWRIDKTRQGKAKRKKKKKIARKWCAFHLLCEWCGVWKMTHDTVL